MPPKRGPPPTPPEVASLLDEAADLFEGADFEGARAKAEAALALCASHPEALHLKAAALLEAGDQDRALDAFRQAHKAAPDDLEVLLGLCDVLVCHRGEERELVEEGLGLCDKGARRAAKADDSELQFEFLLLAGTALNQVGECERALEVLGRAVSLCPGSAEAALERAIALFESCRFTEAQAAFEDVLRRSPEEPWAHHHLGLLFERRGEHAEAKKRFLRAQELSPEDFPPPVACSDEDFDRAVEDAIFRLPEHVKGYLDNATIAVEPIPKDEDLTSGAPPLSPTILGVFRGPTVGDRGVTDAWGHETASITLYQRNLERFARTREELLEQIGITIMHEVGHLIGLDEHDLWERGLE